jgi:hypothetical protein
MPAEALGRVGTAAMVRGTAILDWPFIQEILFRLSAKDIKEFAAKHGDEVFYGLFMDCNSSYGDVLLHLNTPELLQQQAWRYKHDLQSVGGAAILPDLYANKTITQLEDELRWSGGDWGYFEINRRHAWDADWEPIRKMIAEVAAKSVGFQEDFMRTACRVLLQIESCGVLDLLLRTQDFRTICADHDESVEDAAKRLDRARKELAET